MVGGGWSWLEVVEGGWRWLEVVGGGWRLSRSWLNGLIINHRDPIHFLFESSVLVSAAVWHFGVKRHPKLVCFFFSAWVYRFEVHVGYNVMYRR